MVTRREFMAMTAGAAAGATIAPQRLYAAQGETKPFVLLIGGLCFHDSDDSDDYRVWMPKCDGKPETRHHAALIVRKDKIVLDAKAAASRDKTLAIHGLQMLDIGRDLVSIGLDGLDVTVSSLSPTAECILHNKSLAHSYELPYPRSPELMASWAGLDWFMPCRKFLPNPLIGMKQRYQNSACVLHVTDGDVGAVWPVGDRVPGVKGQLVKLWEISVDKKVRAVRAMPNWALAQVPGSTVKLSVSLLPPKKEYLGTFHLNHEAAIVFLPEHLPTKSIFSGNATEHFELYNPILKQPHKEVTIVNAGATLQLERNITKDLDKRVSDFIDEVEDFFTKKPIPIRTKDGQDFEIRTVGSQACPPSHDP